MLTGMIVFIVIILFFVFFAVYKRDMLVRMFTLNAATPAGEFQQELERTADAAIRRLETQIAHLELLLDEADARIAELDARLQAVGNLPPAPAEAPRPVMPPWPTAAGPATNAAKVDVRLAPEAPPVAAAAPPEESPARESLSPDRRKQILSMAELGYSVTEIAKATGTGKGEIMLLLQLNKK